MQRSLEDHDEQDPTRASSLPRNHPIGPVHLAGSGNPTDHPIVSKHHACLKRISMADTQWQLLPPNWLRDSVFRPALLDIHRDIYRRFFENDPRVNPQLGFHLHAYCRSTHWRATLILTPWMMSRLLFPEHDPHILIPDGWSGEDRSQSEYQIVGPSLKLGCCGNAMVANLNYHTQLGHYLIQPFALGMRNFKTPREAFEIWNKLFYTHALSMQRLSKQAVKKRLKQRKKRADDRDEGFIARDGTFDHTTDN